MVLTEPSRGREAERRQLTVLFCDLVESTRIATTLDPEDMSDLLDRFFQACTSAIVNFGGVVGNYVGDGLLAYFGYPIANEDDAERSVRAARAIVESVGRLRTPAGDVLQVRIGIATGLVLASGARDLDRPERGVVGETLNLASRLQAAAEPGEIVVSDPTRRLLGKMFGLRALAAQSLKGCGATNRVRKTVNQRDKKLTAMCDRISCFILVARAIINLIDAARQSGRCFGGLAGVGSAWGFFSFDRGAAPVAFDVHFEDGGVVNEAVDGG